MGLKYSLLLVLQCLTPRGWAHRSLPNRAVAQLNLQLGGPVVLVLEVNGDSPEVFHKPCQPRVVAGGFWARFGVGRSPARRAGAVGGQHPAQGGGTAAAGGAVRSVAGAGESWGAGDPAPATFQT